MVKNFCSDNQKRAQITFSLIPFPGKPAVTRHFALFYQLF